MTVKVTFTATLENHEHADDETFVSELRIGWDGAHIDVDDILADSTSLEVEFEVE
jgi:hypothetical protein